ncbi:MAG TPA: hypothetical protein GX506_07775 [Firmicutes bacterium]|nr:hypothetical protein [Bacillota bacterium]
MRGNGYLINKRAGDMTSCLVSILLICMALMPSLASADSPASRGPGGQHLTMLPPGRNISLSIYQNNIAVVREIRDVPLVSGENFLGITDIPGDIDVSSVNLRFMPVSQSDPLPLVLSYYVESDMLSRPSLIRRFVGREIEISENGTTYRCVLVSATGDSIVVRRGDSLVVDPPGTLILPLGPDDMVNPNCLRFQVRSSISGTREAELSYRVGNLSWGANYFGVLDRDDTRLALSAWATISNMTDLSYEGAGVKLVAGDIMVSRAGSVQQTRKALQVMPEAPAMAGGPSELPEATPLFEYHSFTLPRPVSLPARTSKHVQLMGARNFAVKKVFMFEGPGYGGVEPFTGMKQQLSANVVLEFSNTGSDSGPLPRGKVSIYRYDASGSLELVGEDVIPETAKDEKVRLLIGRAFDIVGEKTVTDYRRTSSRSYEEACSIKLRNRKGEDVEVVVLQRFMGDWTLSSPLPWKKIDASTVEFRLKVPKDKEVEILYRVKVSG